MELIDRIFARRHSTLPQILQSEQSECGLACLAMIAGFHGLETDLRILRNRFSVSQKGSSLADIIRMAGLLNFVVRPVKLDIDQIAHLKLPCILHWNFDHFVVLESVNKNTVDIIDPARGRKKVAVHEVSEAFTGIALELQPDKKFEKKVEREKISLKQLVGHLSGIKRSFLQIILLALALEVFAVISPLYLQLILDKVVVSQDTNLLNVLFITFVAVLVINRVLDWTRNWMLLYLSTTVNVQWRSNVLHHLLRLPASYFEKRHLGDVVSRFNAIDVIQRTLTVSFIEAVLDGLMVIVTLIIMLLYSPTLSLVTLLAMALYTLFRYSTYRPLKRAMEEKAIHAANFDTNLIETIRGVKAIKIFSRHQDRHALSMNLLVNQMNAGISEQKIQLIYRAVNLTIFGIERILVLYFGAKLVLSGVFTIGVLVVFNIYRERFGHRVTSLVDKYFELKALKVHTDRLSDIVLSNRETTHSEYDTSILTPSIEVTNLRFSYSTGAKPIIDNVSFSISAGESVAIIGPSGCGKTTLINLMLGIYQPESGVMYVGGVSLEELGFNNIRSIVGIVMQDDILFSGSIMDNICFFDSNKDEIFAKECAERACIHDEVCRLPMGYYTLVGNMGSALSGGQKQRLLIARALYKKPKILFLDEATSHLDISLEKRVNKAISQLNITRVIVAHRLDTIKSADRIIELPMP